MSVGSNDVLVAWVYLDPANPPQEIMLLWNDGDWSQGAYWGTNLINFGILPLTFEDPADWDRLHKGDRLELPQVRRLLLEGAQRLPLKVEPVGGGEPWEAWVRVDLTPRQRRLIALGGALNLAREE